MSNEVPGVKSTKFNPYLVHESADTGSHTIFRTKDDLPSFIAGSLRDKGNIEINTVNSLYPNNYWQKTHHSLSNFFKNRPDARDVPEEHKFRLQTPEEQEEMLKAEQEFPSVPEQAEFDARMRELADPLSVPQNSDPTLPTDVDIIEGEHSREEGNDQEHWGNFRDNFRDQWGLDEDQMSNGQLAEMYRESFPEKISNSVEESLTRPLEDAIETGKERLNQYHMDKLQRHAHADTLVNDVIPNMEDGLSYTEHVHKVNQARGGKYGIDTIVTPEGEVKLNPEQGRMGRHTLFHKLWEQSGGKFTDEEEEYFDKFADADETIGQDSLLSDEEVKSMVNEEGLDGDTFNKIKQESFDSNDALNGVIDSPPEDFLHVGQDGSEFRPTPQGGGPSWSHGLASGGAGMLASTLVDYTLANTEFGKTLSVPEKTALSSSVGGAAGEAVYSRLATGSALSGAGIGIAGTTGLGVAGASAAAGALVTVGTEYGVDKGLKSLGVENKDVRDITKDEVGNVAGALTTVATTALSAAALGVPFDAVTFGCAAVVAGLIGAGVGSIQYLEDKTHFAEKAWAGFKSLF